MVQPNQFFIWCLALVGLITLQTCSAYRLPEMEVNQVVHFNLGDSLAEVGLWHGKAFEARKSRTYHWFASGKPHQTRGAYSGKPMHGSFQLTDANHDLIEKGSYQKGLKKGTWTRWYSNGTPMKINRYSRGTRQGRQKSFDAEGRLEKISRYRKGVKTGWEKEYLPTGSVKKRLFRKGKLLKETIRHKTSGS